MAEEYLLSAALMMLGGTLGIMFVTILRRVMVEDHGPALPRVGGGVRDPQGRPEGLRGGAAAVPRHVRRRRRSSCSTASASSAPRTRWRSRSAGPSRASCASASATTAPKVVTGGVTHFSAPGHHAGVLRRRLHHRSGTRLAELRRRPAGVGPVRADARVLPRARRSSTSTWRRTAATRRRPGAPWWSTSGSSSSGRSRSAACWSAPPSRCTRCARTSSAASSAASTT